jgi:hypothetical protein
MFLENEHSDNATIADELSIEIAPAIQKSNKKKKKKRKKSKIKNIRKANKIK